MAPVKSDLCSPEPSPLIVYISAFPFTFEVKAIRFPSGDHAGAEFKVPPGNRFDFLSIINVDHQF